MPLFISLAQAAFKANSVPQLHDHLEALPTRPYVPAHRFPNDRMLIAPQSNSMEP